MARVSDGLRHRRPARVRIRVRVLLVAVVSSWLLTILPAPVRLAAREARPGAAAQQPGTAIRMDIDYVNVDVTVTDEQGRFVRDLTLQDFEVYEDSKRQDVSTFALVEIPIETRPRADAAGGTPARVEPDVRSNGAESAGRVYVIVLDDLHVAPLRSAQVKAVARQFIERHLGPNDLAAVVHTSGRSDASQEFTTSRRLLLQAVDRFVGRKLRSSVLERLDEYERRIEESTRADIRMNRTIDPLDAQRADQARRMIKTVTNLGDLLAQSRGRRKAIVLISEGVDYDLQQGSAQTSSGLTTFTSTYAPDILRELQQAIRAAARANISVYAIDPRGLAGTGDEMIEVGSFPENPHLGLTPAAFQDELRNAQDSLRIISDQTGGLASVSSNDFASALDRIVSDNSTYYMLGYRSSNGRRDGRYRTIDVRVKRPGVRVRARSGYAAVPAAKTGPGILSSAVEPSAAVREALNAPLPIAALPLRLFAAPFRGAKEASVSVGVEIDARTFRFEQKDGFYTDRLEVALVALDDQAKFRIGDRQTVELRLKPETYRAVQANGLRMLFRLNLPPGRFQLRAAAHESGARAMGSVFYDLEVPDFSKAPLSASGMILTATRAALVPTARPDPMFEGVLPSPPTSARAFQADETVTAFFELYGGAAASPASVDVVTSVRGTDGQVRFRSDQQVVGQELRGGNGVGYTVRIPLADMPAGPYTVRVEARGRANADQVVVREVPIEISAPKPAEK